jgi:predicted  nucleic acid-binding Zn-ribbon protein
MCAYREDELEDRLLDCRSHVSSVENENARLLDRIDDLNSQIRSLEWELAEMTALLPHMSGEE